MRKFLVCCLLLVIINSVKAQNIPPLINSGEVLTNAGKLYENGKYKEAISLYKTVHPSDTNYSKILFQLALTSYFDSSYDESIGYAKKGLELFPEDAYEWYGMLGNAYDNMKKPEEAISYYNKVLELNPNHYRTWYNKGISFYNQKNYKDAKACFQRCLLIYPYYTSAHYFLAQVYIQEGKPVPAFFALSANLMMDPTNRYAFNATSTLGELAKAQDNVIKTTIGSDDNFELLQEILTSKIALNTKYKLKTDVDDPITRQLQALLEKAEFDASDKGFVMQFYVPMIKLVYDNGRFNTLVNYMFSGLKIKSVDNYVKRNKKEVDAVIDDIVRYCNEIRRTQQLQVNDRKNVKLRYFYNGSVMYGKGEWTGEGDKVIFKGPWEFYYESGLVRSKGSYDDNEQRQGEWRFYYDNGSLKEITFYKDGNPHGSSKAFYKNGVLYAEETYKNGKLNGTAKYYYYTGILKEIINYRDDLKQGRYQFFNDDGMLEYVAGFRENKKQGRDTLFYATGEIQGIANYADGLANGPYKKFSTKGKVIKQGEYLNDKANGEWKEFYDDGKLKAVYTYAEGDYTGLYKELYENGNVQRQMNYVKGKIEGKAEDFDEDGKLFCETVYERNRLREIKFFDKKGQLISSNSSRNGAANISFFDVYGNKTSEGYFSKDGLQQGKFNYYYRSGKQSSYCNYKDGQLEGEKVVYYQNGGLSEKMVYKEDLLHGYYQSYHLTGKPSIETWMLNDKKQGPYVSYNQFGAVKFKGYYVNNDLEGATQNYYPDGKIDYEEVFKDGWLTKMIEYDANGKIAYTTLFDKGNGPIVFHHANGKKYIEGTYKNHKLNGSYNYFFFDGSPFITQAYINGKLDGDYKQYFYGGKLRTEGRYNKGEMAGEWKYYYDNGTLYSSDPYEDGKINGKSVIYTPDGNLEREINYKDGNLEGQFIYYGENKMIGLILNFHNGVLMSYTYEGKDGKLVAPIEVKNGTAQVKAFYRNGNKSAEIDFENSDYNGKRIFYFTNGKVYQESVKFFDQDNGTRRIYYTNGQLAVEENYVYGNLHGKSMSYHKNGKLKSEENWYDDARNGVCKFYDESGKLVQTRNYYYGHLLSAQ